MQEIKEHLRRLGEKFQHGRGDHQALLRQKLQTMDHSASRVPTKSFSLFPFFGLGIASLGILVITVQFFDSFDTAPVYAPFVAQEAALDSTGVETGLAGGENARVVADGSLDEMIWAPLTVTLPYGNDDISGYLPYSKPKDNEEDLIAYEEKYGAMLEQSVSIRLLTREDNASETVSTLFASLGGRLSSIHDTSGHITITGSLPATRMSFFYEELDTLVKNDAFLEKTVRGTSVTQEAMRVTDRLEALRASEVTITAQLHAATTDEEKQRLQAQLERISRDIVFATEDQQKIESRVDYVTVSVVLETLPSLWEAENVYELRTVIAGYENPSLWQQVLMNVLMVFFLLVKIMSVAFWIIIPVGYFIIRGMRRRRLLRALE